MNSYKKLFNNIIIFSLGSLGSKLISFLLVPLYTYYLSKTEYGTVDIVTVTVSMLIPIVSACMYEALLRFIMDKNFSRSEIFTNAMGVSLAGFSILIFLYPLLHYYQLFNDNLMFLYLLLFVQMVNQNLAQYTRAVGQSKIFALSGILNTLLIGILNIIFLAYFNLGIFGYYLALILAYSLTIFFILITVNPFKEFRFSDLSIRISKNMLSYSIPLIPNSLMWWLINSSSRYFINGFVGIQANGLFAVSIKIPSIINLISQIFTQAWQLSAFEEYDNDRSSTFYSDVLNFYISILLISCSIIIIFLKPLSILVFSEDYLQAWMPVPFLLLGSSFSSFSGFIGVTYTASKQTKGVFKTSFFGGVISFLTNLVFIPIFGIIGAGLSSMISFFVMFVIRYFDTKDIVTLNIRWINLLFTVILLLFQTLLLFLDFSLNLEIMSGIVIFIIILTINKSVLMIVPFVLKIIKKHIKRK